MSDAEMVEALCELDSGLTSWELEFLESVAEQVENGHSLSERQREKLVEIHERLLG